MGELSFLWGGGGLYNPLETIIMPRIATIWWVKLEMKLFHLLYSSLLVYILLCQVTVFFCFFRKDSVTAQKKKFSIKNFFNKCDQIRIII